MPDAHMLSAWLADTYPLQPVTIGMLRPAQADRRLCHVREAGGAQWSVRLHRADAPAPPWLNVPGQADWLNQQAQILGWCCGQGFPVPRVAHTRRGQTTGTFENWSVLVTEYVAGTRRTVTPESLRCAANLLGRLHRLGLGATPGDLNILPWSWWAPVDGALRRAAGLFASVASVPVEWQSFMSACEAALRHCQLLGDLPQTVIHADAHLGNIIYDEADECRLVDWEFAGRGTAILDFGGLLSDCFRYPNQPHDVDELAVAAVAEGYARHHALSPAELDALPAAIRFGVAYRTAARSHLALRDRWDEGIQRGFRREQARFALSEAVARHARQHMTGPRGA
jgi:Ser/Thr protein kinase RdoA (MazF antagonist)